MIKMMMRKILAKVLPMERFGQEAGVWASDNASV